MVTPSQEKECELLLVEFSPSDALPFTWLTLTTPGLRIEKTSLTRALAETGGHDYGMIFIDIPAEPSQLEWFLIGELVCRQQARRPMPVVVPVVASGNILQGMSRLLCQVAPVYLTRPVELNDLQQVVRAFASEAKAPPNVVPRTLHDQEQKHAVFATSSR
ncbi:MAG: hypothetical protein EON92_12935 [Burkholderiales bacterium]|nr:MAG: hypothetical protein EON92_12935 [Burkholderiales bacterium]